MSPSDKAIPGRAGKSRPVSVDLLAENNPRRSAGVTTPLPEGFGAIAGVVTSPSGEPVAGCGLGVQVVAPAGVFVPDIAIITRGDGYYRFVLPSATYQVWAAGTDSGNRPMRASVSDIAVNPGQTTELNIALVSE